MMLNDLTAATRSALTRTVRPVALAAALAVTAFAAAPASAVTITTTHFTGDVLLAAENNPFGLLVGDQINGFVTIDTDLLNFIGPTDIFIENEPSSEFFLQIGSFTFGTKTDGDGNVLFDDDEDAGFPIVTFEGNKLVGIDFLHIGAPDAPTNPSDGGFGDLPNLVLDATPFAALADPDPENELEINWVIYDEETGEDILAGVFNLGVDVGTGPDGGSQVPEPGALALVGLGLAGFAAARRRRKA